MEESKTKTIEERLQEGFESAVQRMTTNYQTLEIGAKARFVSYLEGLVSGSLQRETITNDQIYKREDRYIIEIKSFGLNLKEFRKSIRLTQSELSDLLNKLPNKSRKYHRTFIAKLEAQKLKSTSGPRCATVDEMRRDIYEIAKEYSENFDESLEYKYVETPKSEDAQYFLKIRKDLGLTQRALAKELNKLPERALNYSYVKIHSYETNPTPRKVNLIRRDFEILKQKLTSPIITSSH
ncbi:MAG: hypothetical protein AABX95_01270 [Nanoarchaeota archaeon]